MHLHHPAPAIGVFGAASRFTEAQVFAAFHIGQTIVHQGCYLITGATTGVPLAAAIGAQSAGGLVVGISPASSPELHVTHFERPLSYHDAVIYTGMGVEGRQPVTVRSAQGAIFIGGEFGTLAEFANAWTSGDNVLGVLRGVGGVSDLIEDICTSMYTSYGSLIIVDDEPLSLARSVCTAVKKRDLGAGRLEQVPDNVRSVCAMLSAAGISGI